VPAYELVQVTSRASRRRRRRSVGTGDAGDDARAAGEHPDHVIKLNALGQEVSLNLEHNDEFHERNFRVPVYAADADVASIKEDGGMGKLKYEKIDDRVSEIPDEEKKEKDHINASCKIPEEKKMKIQKPDVTKLRRENYIQKLL
jgi:hypothetical protein